MRLDEEYVKKSLENYLSHIIDGFIITEGDEPPDYYVIYNNEKIILEVTRAEPIYLDEGLLQNRRTVDETLIQLCDQLNEEIGEKIDSNKSLLVYIKGPLINYIKFKNSIKYMILSILTDGYSTTRACEDWIEIEISKNVIEVKLVDSSPLRKRISAIIGINNNKAIVDIEAQASLILTDIIRKKEKKTKIINGVNWDGKKWLGILNNYWLASDNTYIRVLSNFKESHTFSKIFLIEKNLKVTEIYSNNV